MKRSSKLLTLLVVLAMTAAFMPITAFAEGSYYIDRDYLNLAPGETGYVTITADQATGRVDWSSSGAVTAGGSAWIDNGSQTIEITAGEAGTGYVTITPYDIATYDGEVLDNSYTIQIDIVGNDIDTAGQLPAQEEPVNDGNTNNDNNNNDNTNDNTNNDDAAAEDDAAAATAQTSSGDVLTDGNNDYEALSNEERLYTTVDGQELYIIQYPLFLDENGDTVWNDEIYNLERLTGFELKTVNYKGVDVDTFQYKDVLTVFVLKNLETDVSDYYVIGENGFEPLTYVTANGKQYIVVDFPKDFVVPEGYQMVELALGNKTIKALKNASETSAAPEEETTTVPEAQTDEVVTDAEGNTVSITLDSRTAVMLKGYETQVSPGLDSKDPTADIYYIYCLVNGETQLYSYDSGEGTLQRAAITVYNEIPTEPQTVIVYETAPSEGLTADDSILTGIGWNAMPTQIKILLVALAVAIILIIILIICFAVMSHRNKKMKKQAAKQQMDRYAKSGRKNEKGAPDRRRRDAEKDDDESFFSYVKTEKDDFNLEDLK